MNKKGSTGGGGGGRKGRGRPLLQGGVGVYQAGTSGPYSNSTGGGLGAPVERAVKGWLDVVTL